MNLYIPSVVDVARLFVSAYKRNNYDEIGELKEYLANAKVATSIAGTADEFHNAAVNLTRNGFYEYGYAIVQVGVWRYPKNTDLLGDLLAYGLHCKNIYDQELRKWYLQLKDINKRFWTWRAYQFSFDYLMEYLPYAKAEEVEIVEDSIKQLINDFKENFRFLKDKSDCEKAYMMEFEYYSSLGKDKEAEKALNEATKILEGKCAQCAFKLADRRFEQGDYAGTINYARIAIGIKEDQPSINLGYANYILAMSLERECRTKNALGAREDLEEIYQAYYAAYNYMADDVGRERLMSSIRNQVKLLEYSTGIPSKIDFDNSNNRNRLTELLKDYVSLPEKED